MIGSIKQRISFNSRPVPLDYDVVVKVVNFGPHTSGMDYAVMQDTHRPSSIFFLFLPCGPSAIPWSVRSVSVFALDCMIRRWKWSHIFHESQESILRAPLRAHFNPSPSVVLVRSVVGILASVLHIAPLFPLWNLFGSFGVDVAMRMLMLITALTVSFSKICLEYWPLCSALAPAHPFARVDIHESNKRPSSESVPWIQLISHATTIRGCIG